MKNPNHVTLFDTTLRDGQQTPGVDFSVEEKIIITNMLDELGVDYIEGGYPGANPIDDAFFSQPRTKHARFTGFGMTKRAGVSASNDPGLKALLDAPCSAICFVGKAWDYHVRVALGTTNEANLESISQSIIAALDIGKEALLDCEHFFDGYKANPDYAMACARAAHDAGASWVVLCDTNGGTQPHEIEAIVTDVLDTIPEINIGIHAHNDTGQAVANSLAAIRAGARHVQGTINGIGERCGNANLLTIAATLALKPAYQDYAISLDDKAIKSLTDVSRRFDAILNRSPDAQAPYVGTSAFATKAGIHASALLKEPETYEHVPPQSVGNLRRVMVSDQSGKSNFINQLNDHGIEVAKDDLKLDKLISLVKEREALGYAYEMADASFKLLALRTLKSVPSFFEVESFRVQVERRFDARGNKKTVSEGVVRVKVDGETRMSVAEGNGPVNALDNALRKDLGSLQSKLEDLELVDYKVRILDGGTQAVTRVLIESTDKTSKRWWTVGVSENIIEASFEALMDSVEFKLMRD